MQICSPKNVYIIKIYEKMRGKDHGRCLYLQIFAVFDYSRADLFSLDARTRAQTL